MSAQTDAVNAALDSVDAHLDDAAAAQTLAQNALDAAKARVAALPAGDDLTPIVTRINGQDTRVQTLGAGFTALANEAGTIAS